jgi:hypothetical protein
MPPNRPAPDLMSDAVRPLTLSVETQRLPGEEDHLPRPRARPEKWPDLGVRLLACRAPEVPIALRLSSSEAAKNLIRHLDSPGLRPNESGSPAPTVQACFQVPSAGFGGHSEGQSTDHRGCVNRLSRQRANFLRRLTFQPAETANMTRWVTFFCGSSLHLFPTAYQVAHELATYFPPKPRRRWRL